MSSRPPVVAIFNTSPDTVELLRIVLENAGFVVISAYTHDLREAKVDIEGIVRQYAPQLIIYDIAPPYDKNWRQFLITAAMPALRNINFLITTTNARHVQAIAGADQTIYEIVGKPYDLDILVGAVKDVVKVSSDQPQSTSVSSRPS
jgi:DNA-binding NtrC family response regulator